MAGAVCSGEDVLGWFDTGEATQQAWRVASRWGLGGYEGLAENLLQDARFEVWRRQQSATPLVVDNPAAYGTVVIKSVARRVAQGRDHVSVEVLGDELVAETVVDLDQYPTDDLRVVVERLADKNLWVTSAALSYVTLRAYPEIELDGVPAPAAGATPDQALGWPALWFAGKRDEFPREADSTRDRARKNTARARKIRKVLDHLREAGSIYLFERRDDDG